MPSAYLSTASSTFQVTPALRRLRNIGISAHIDSGKTTLSERILFYTGRINEIHEVRGRDGVGATMDSMDLEREKGITIQSAATYTQWKDHHINIIDTPGHVDFTIEVERALRVLDGAVMVLCAVGGVQSQSMTVDRQMKRYAVPRLIFINKLDRGGADPYKGLEQVKKQLGHNAAVVQIPIGLERDFEGVVDIVHRRALYFDGANGEKVREAPVPANLVETMEAKRAMLIEQVAGVDDELLEAYFADASAVTPDMLKAAIRRACVALKFVPVFMGAAFKNKGVQPLLDGVLDYLPNPSEVKNVALDLNKKEEPVTLSPDPKGALVAYGFKLEENRFGQLTYVRVYQGTLRKGDWVYNCLDGKKVKIPRVVRMHANQMEDVTEVAAGEICAVFGVECNTGTTFTDGSVKYSMSSMFVPEPVMSLFIEPKDPTKSTNFLKALQRFSREDPTFRLGFDQESKQTIISGMGELHLEIYRERMFREYGVETKSGMPQVKFRETPTERANFDYTHKKQSGGAGQYGRLIGYIEPLPLDSPINFEFDNQLTGNVIPPELYGAVEKGFLEAIEKGNYTGNPVVKCRVVITDGKSHVVDSNENAFRAAAIGSFRDAWPRSKPCVLEPIMKVEVEAPQEFQASVASSLNRRMGQIQETTIRDGVSVMQAHVPLNKMFGYSTDLRGVTQGKGEFSMEFLHYAQLNKTDEQKLVAEYHAKLAARNK